MSTVEQFLTPIKWKTEEITATASQTVFTLSTVSIPNADEDRAIVSINGSKQLKTAYTVNSTTQITTSEGLEAGDILEVTVIGRS